MDGRRKCPAMFTIPTACYCVYDILWWLESWLWCHQSYRTCGYIYTSASRIMRVCMSICHKNDVCIRMRICRCLKIHGCYGSMLQLDLWTLERGCLNLTEDYKPALVGSILTDTLRLPAPLVLSIDWRVHRSSSQCASRNGRHSHECMHLSSVHLSRFRCVPVRVPYTSNNYWCSINQLNIWHGVLNSVGKHGAWRIRESHEHFTAQALLLCTTPDKIFFRKNHQTNSV